MDANEFIKGAYRMCNSHNCDECPAREGVCIVSMSNTSSDSGRKRYISIVEKWAKEHPLKTNTMKLEEVFGQKISNFFRDYVSGYVCEKVFKDELKRWLGEEHEERKEK